MKHVEYNGLIGILFEATEDSIAGGDLFKTGRAVDDEEIYGYHCAEIISQYIYFHMFSGTLEKVNLHF